MLNPLKRLALLLAAALVTLLVSACISSDSSSEPTGVRVSIPPGAAGGASSPFEQAILEYLGHGWDVAASTDMTGDTQIEVVAYKPATIEIASEFTDPAYVDFVLLASEVAIVHKEEGEDEGEPQILLSVTPEGATSGDVSLIDISNTAAFLVRYMPASSTQVAVIPLDAEGKRAMQSLGFAWNSETRAYDLVMSSE